ncbi:MAG: asparagine synthase (glutamine-hydrolyzing) [Lachnospiraceae bacterium]|nr:asparagine synthase (glutamine-hydrolyzing) [Lachnospiraceae bacterium]
MCSIAGFCNHQADYTLEPSHWEAILHKMNEVQKRRGPDGDGILLAPQCGLAHTRLAIIDIDGGTQPMTRTLDGRTCSLCYNGELYNMPALRTELEQEGIVFSSHSDTEVILHGFLLHGPAFVEKMNGIFALAIWDETSRSLYLFRDRVGVKPLFYMQLHNTLLFSSELKGILSHPDASPLLDQDGLCEILALGPAKSYGKGVFKDIYEVLPGHFLHFQDGRLQDICYWKLESRPHTEDFDTTVEHTAWLIEDAVTLQMLSDIPISTFLSGGIDSSLVTSICARKLHSQGKQLNTFSFDFEGNGRYFHANSFQPSQDRPWVDKMVAYADTNHFYLECDNSRLIENLYRAVDARDLPCMADVESSMLYFCSLVVPHNKVTLTGECADEIFGGYPWFHSKQAFETDAFPWSIDMSPRQVLLSDEVIHTLPMEEYAHAAYERTISETPLLEGESPTERRRREIAYLNLKWFMVTLLDRMDRTSMYSGLEARVPLADHRILEYVWNVPWEMKCKDGIVKGLLRHAGKNKLPEEVLWRKKSPYPKTYHPEYEALLGNQLKEVLADPGAPIRQLLDLKKVHKFLNSEQDYGKPWYGQLMAGPQMLAFMLQFNYWLETYHVSLI